LHPNINKENIIIAYVLFIFSNQTRALQRSKINIKAAGYRNLFVVLYADSIIFELNSSKFISQNGALTPLAKNASARKRRNNEIGKL